ncbi:mitochondrial enolase superfamily member 1 [Grus japonensis]|uniref:Mitochondrial enolase superfamily member 1 n=1 Tax=Grus japonensis TaxID=30415 RepID=A0ABC9Y4L1_GRUJA
MLMKEMPEDWRKASDIPLFKNGKEFSQPHLDPWRGGGAANPRNHFQRDDMPMERLMKYGLTVRETENWLNGQAQGLVQSLAGGSRDVIALYS